MLSLRESGRGDFSISMDLIVEILKKLPAKSLVRFRSVSKQWSSIIGRRRDFIESIVNRSLAPLPLFILHNYSPEDFCTVSFITESTKHAELYVPKSCSYRYVRGLICCSSPISHLVTIYNPTTRQFFSLPEIRSSPMVQYEKSEYYFGYDPIMNQYKVLNIIVENLKQTCHVFTLERGQSWRKIQSIDEKEKLSLWSCQVCIDGTIYFVARKIIEENNFGEYMLLSFNILSEKFDHVWAPESLLRAMLMTSCYDHGTLVNYQGKLGCICCSREDTSIWIMDNVEKQEWSRIIFWLPAYPLRLLGDFMELSGITTEGEIVFTPRVTFVEKSLIYVYYYNIKQTSFRRVEIKNIRPPRYWIHVYVIDDYVENTMWL